MTNPTDAEIWGWGTLSVTVITLTSVVGIVLIGTISKASSSPEELKRFEKRFEMIKIALFSLGSAVLLGDAALHLIPHGLGLHVHKGDHEAHEGEDHDDHDDHDEDHHDDDDDHDDDHDDNHDHDRRRREADEHAGHENHKESDSAGTLVWKLNTFFFCFFLFYLIDVMLKRHRIKSIEAMSTNEKNDSDEKKSDVVSDQFKDYTPCKKFIAQLKQVFTLFIGDAIHNFVDGLTIAAAFSISPSVGLGTSIAVFCHELPHELADFMVYFKKTGDWKNSLLLNVLSALFCYLGLFVGIGINSLSDTPQSKEFLLMVAASSFIYITAIHLLPELELEKTKHEECFSLKIVLAVFFMLVGWSIMYVLAWFEEDLNEAFV